MDEFGNVGWGATVTATAQSGEVVVEARFNEDVIQPRFVLPIVRERVLPVRAFVVNDTDGPILPAESIRAKIDFSNTILRQVGVFIDLLSISNNVGSVADLVLPMTQLYTNSAGRVYVSRSERATALLNTYSEGDCVELYFVNEIEDLYGNTPGAFKSPLGIVISKRTTAHAMAHEIGHALGLEDCYVLSTRKNPPIMLVGVDDPVNAAVFSATWRDWGQETSRGFYPSGEHVRSILSEMLMYGVDVGESLDIPNGTVYSLRKNATTPRQTFSSKVGAEFIITDITEVYSR